ncbi:hypothetical protein, partial [Anaerotignum lactatifermentans]|uniref:hypothetical protein n=1 Tax=Anaerotignum lactatifermentans TaxID=160404 RepID=UPI00258882D3
RPERSMVLGGKLPGRVDGCRNPVKDFEVIRSPFFMFACKKDMSVYLFEYGISFFVPIIF